MSSAARALGSCLIVDDHDRMRSLLRDLLSESASLILECSDGGQAVEAYDAHHPDLVLMDIEMPVLDGLEATRRILEADDRARVVIVTQHDDPTIRRAASEAGAVGYVPKSDLSQLQNFLPGRLCPDSEDSE